MFDNESMLDKVIVRESAREPPEALTYVQGSAMAYQCMGQSPAFKWTPALLMHQSLLLG